MESLYNEDNFGTMKITDYIRVKNKEIYTGNRDQQNYLVISDLFIMRLHCINVLNTLELQ